MKDMESEDRKEKQDDDLLAIDDDYAKKEQAVRRRHIFQIALLILVVVGLVFSDTLMEYFTGRREKPSTNRVETVAKTKMVRVSAEERQALLGRVNGLLDEGKVNDALNLLVQHLGRDPEFAEAQYLAGAAYLRQGRIQSAYSHLKQATALRPDYYEAQEKLGEIYLIAGDYKAAREISTKLTKGEEYLQDGLRLESEIALAEGHLTLALQKAKAAMADSKKPPKVKTSAYLAALYLQKGDTGKADEIVKKLDIGSMDAEGLLSLAKFYLGAGKDAQALSFFKQALKRYPDSAEVNYNYAQYLFSKDQLREAIVYYRKALGAFPNVQIIAYRLSQCLLASGQRSEAKTHIDAMTQRYPNSILTLGLKFQYHILAGERRPAIDALNQMTKLIPAAPRPYIVLANLYWQEGMIPQAEKNAFKAMKLGEKTVLPHLMIGDILFIKRQFQQSMAYYDRVLEVQPDNIVALLQTGDLYLNMGQPKRAEERYRKAFATNPRIKSLQTKIAWAKAMGGDLEGALDLDRQYMREAPNDPQAINAYVNVLISAKRLDEAVDTVQKSIKKQPREWSLHYLLGDLYLLKNDFKSAAASYAIALALNPGDIPMALNVGARYEKNASDGETEKYYLEIRKKYPDEPLIANQLAWLYIERMETPQKAKELVEFLMADKERPEVKDTIGWYYYKLGNYVAAENYFREALQLAPDQYSTRARLALTLFSLKKNQEAEGEAKKVVALLAPSPLKIKLEQAMTKGKI
ncbi:MAG: tetratricopeptide repeat protein [Deltaproteobacteria bacterium]|nr:tetratricopeptide repeat protein [Deltaproteobacteria bacterium]